MPWPKGQQPSAEMRARLSDAQRLRFGPLEARFWAAVDKDGPVPGQRPFLGPCWLWLASGAGGYGTLAVNRRKRGAHRVAYELLVGPIPDGLQLDHLCRNRRCVNPSHLEPVTQRENLLRGETIPAHEAAQTHCTAGHPFTESNTYAWHGQRKCRQCRKAADRRRRRRP